MPVDSCIFQHFNIEPLHKITESGGKRGKGREGTIEAKDMRKSVLPFPTCSVSLYPCPS